MSVTTTTYSDATAYAYQRKLFKINGLYWVWFVKSSNLVYSTSANGATWATAVTIGSCAHGYDASVTFDGTYVHYARYYNYYLFYRRGIPETDGTITWSAGEQTVHYASGGTYYMDPSIAVDSAGNAWIGARYRYVFGAINFHTPAVLKNNNTDGTWSTASGFPHSFSTTSDDSWRVLPA